MVQGDSLVSAVTITGGHGAPLRARVTGARQRNTRGKPHVRWKLGRLLFAHRDPASPEFVQGSALGWGWDLLVIAKVNHFWLHSGGGCRAGGRWPQWTLGRGLSRARASRCSRHWRSSRTRSCRGAWPQLSGRSWSHQPRRANTWPQLASGSAPHSSPSR